MNDIVTLYLETAYQSAMIKASGKEKATSPLNEEAVALLDVVVTHSESCKAAVAVLTTSLVYKHFHPKQDVRRHQSSIEGGYSGRTFDTHYITPFLKQHHFPAMAESGWLTRSFEQKVPYDLNYTGAINPKSVKTAFLSILDSVENGNVSTDELFDYLLQALIIQRDKKVIDLAIPHNLSISELMKVLDRHFHAKYKGMGASRLPVLALYAMYQNLLKEEKRYQGKQLLPLESHNSADAQSGRMGDIDVNDEKGNPFEAVEVKFDIDISYNIVVNAIQKIHTSTVTRYYILSTASVLKEDEEKIESEIRDLKNVHGCQLIINGVMHTLKYYLRLRNDPNDFIKNYTDLLQTDKSIKFEHKQKWNEIVSKIYRL